MSNILGFWKPTGPNGYLSQWYPSPFIDQDGTLFHSAEQYMMYNKALLFHDQEIADEIMTTQDPKKIKKLGREVRNLNPSIWNGYKFEIVVEGNKLKFKQNPELKSALLATNDYQDGPAYLVELSPYDRIWGVGTTSPNPADWNGENLLGQALMVVRNYLTEDSEER